jgi:hypothetical protein
MERWTLLLKFTLLVSDSNGLLKIKLVFNNKVNDITKKVANKCSQKRKYEHTTSQQIPTIK